jgi:hypothetical protein
MIKPDKQELKITYDSKITSQALPAGQAVRDLIAD